MGSSILQAYMGPVGSSLSVTLPRFLVVATMLGTGSLSAPSKGVASAVHLHQRSLTLPWVLGQRLTPLSMSAVKAGASVSRLVFKTRMTVCSS